MKEHNIKILCQMEYEDWRKTNPMDWNKNDILRKLSEMEEAGPGWKPLFNEDDVRV